MSGVKGRESMKKIIYVMTAGLLLQIGLYAGHAPLKVCMQNAWKEIGRFRRNNKYTPKKGWSKGEEAGWSGVLAALERKQKKHSSAELGETIALVRQINAYPSVAHAALTAAELTTQSQGFFRRKRLRQPLDEVVRDVNIDAGSTLEHTIERLVYPESSRKPTRRALVKDIVSYGVLFLGLMLFVEGLRYGEKSMVGRAWKKVTEFGSSLLGTRGGTRENGSVEAISDEELAKLLKLLEKAYNQDKK